MAFTFALKVCLRYSVAELCSVPMSLMTLSAVSAIYPPSTLHSLGLRRRLLRDLVELLHTLLDLLPLLVDGREERDPLDVHLRVGALGLGVVLVRLLNRLAVDVGTELVVVVEGLSHLRRPLDDAHLIWFE